MRKKKLIQKAFLLYSELEMKKLPNDLQIDQTVTKQFEQELERRLQQQIQSFTGTTVRIFLQSTSVTASGTRFFRFWAKSIRLF